MQSTFFKIYLCQTKLLVMQLLVTLFSSLILMSTNVQSSKHDDLYDAIDQMDDVTTMSFSKSMLDGIDLDFDINEKLENVEGDFKKITFTVIGDDFPKNADRVETILKKEFHQLQSEKDNEGHFYMFTDTKGKNISELLFYLKRPGGSSFLISLEGDMILTKNEDE